MSNETIGPVIVRIILRYFAGGLVTWGVVAPEVGARIVADADLQQILLVVVGTVIAAATEWAYRNARVTGGPT